MKKVILFSIALILSTSCSSLSKTQKMEQNMFDPKRKGNELREQKKHEKQNTYKKEWSKTPQRKK